jgi:hypothetical protein
MESSPRALSSRLEDGKLWHVIDKAAHRVTWTECIPTGLGFQTVMKAHVLNSHFNVESTKLKLSDQYFWPGMDADCCQVMLECPRCKSFGVLTLNSLLQPIRCTQPFRLISGDYLSLPLAKADFRMPV